MRDSQRYRYKVADCLRAAKQTHDPSRCAATPAEKARAIIGNMSVDEAEAFLVAFHLYVKELRAAAVVLDDVNEG